jgi:hypothetical protein
VGPAGGAPVSGNGQAEGPEGIGQRLAVLAVGKEDGAAVECVVKLRQGVDDITVVAAVGEYREPEAPAPQLIADWTPALANRSRTGTPE